MKKSTSTSQTRRHPRSAAIRRLLRPRGQKADLARFAGVSPSMVSHWLAGRVQSQALGCAATDMLRKATGTPVTCRFCGEPLRAPMGPLSLVGVEGMRRILRAIKSEPTA